MQFVHIQRILNSSNIKDNWLGEILDNLEAGTDI